MKSTALLLIVKGEKALLFKRSPNDSGYPNVYGLLGGGIEKGETPEQALRREVMEEAGVEITDFKPLKKYTKRTHTFYVFYTIGFKVSQIKLDTKEHTGYKAFTFDEILNSTADAIIPTNKRIVRDYMEKPQSQEPINELDIVKQKQVTWGEAAQLLTAVKQSQVGDAAKNAATSLAKIGLNAVGLGILKDAAEFVSDVSDLAGTAKALFTLGKSISTQELKTPGDSKLKQLTGPFWDALKLSPEISQILDDKIEVEFINKVLVPQISNPQNANQPLPNMDEMLGKWLNKQKNLKNKADVFFKGKTGELTEEEILNEYIRKSNGKWVVYSKKGKRLGTHDTEKEAKAQLAAIEISKAKRG